MTGITVLDALGNPLSDFSVHTESGTFYDRNGVHFAAVPAPATLALFGAGLAGLGAMRRRRKPHKSA